MGRQKSLFAESDTGSNNLSEKLDLLSRFDTSKRECVDVGVSKDSAVDSSESVSWSKDSNGTTQEPPPVRTGERLTPAAAKLIAMWNERAPKWLPRVILIGSKRLKIMNRALKVFPDMKLWEAALEAYYQSRFLMGQAVMGEGHASFKPDFDWFIGNGRSSENIVKILEGKYQDTPEDEIRRSMDPRALRSIQVIHEWAVQRQAYEDRQRQRHDA